MVQKFVRFVCRTKKIIKLEMPKKARLIFSKKKIKKTDKFYRKIKILKNVLTNSSKNLKFC